MGSASLNASQAMGTSMALGGVSSGLNAIGALQGGEATERAAQYNAQIATLNASLAEQNAGWAAAEGQANVGRQELKTRQQQGSIKAAQGANNITIGTGSAGQVAKSQSVVGELDSATIMSNAARQAFGYETQAAADTAQSSLYTAEAKQAMPAAELSAAGSLIGGASTAAGRYAMWLAQGNTASTTASPALNNYNALFG